MKSFLEKLSNVYVLVAVNLAIILSAEFVGGGLYFAQSGVIHLVTILLVFFALVKIISHYSFSDKILKGFLSIQSASLVFLGILHILEYVAHWTAGINMEVVDLFVIVCYLLWFLANILGYAYLSKSSYHGGEKLFKSLVAIICAIIVVIVLAVVFGKNIPEPEEWIMTSALVCAVVVGIATIFTVKKIKTIMPIFRDFVGYLIFANVFVLLAVLFEFFETFSMNVHMVENVSQVQVEYLAHFAIYVALSVLIVGFEKLFHLPGVYAEIKGAPSENK